MRVDRALLTAAIGAALLCGCGAPVDSDSTDTRPAGSPERDVEAVIVAHRTLTRAYENGDADQFVAMLRPSSDLLVYHPRLESRFDGVEEIRDQMVADVRPAGRGPVDGRPPAGRGRR